MHVRTHTHTHTQKHRTSFVGDRVPTLALLLPWGTDVEDWNLRDHSHLLNGTGGPQHSTRFFRTLTSPRSGRHKAVFHCTHHTPYRLFFFFYFKTLSRKVMKRGNILEFQFCLLIKKIKSTTFREQGVLGGLRLGGAGGSHSLQHINSTRGLNTSGCRSQAAFHSTNRPRVCSTSVGHWKPRACLMPLCD